jgi:hypothetical protein
VAAFVARHLLGVTFTVFGLNGIFAFIQLPAPTGVAGQFMAVLHESGYLTPTFVLQLAAGVLLLANRFVPLALALLAPIIVNIALYHALMEPHGLGTAAVVSVLWAIVFYREHAAFAGLLTARTETQRELTQS